MVDCSNRVVGVQLDVDCPIKALHMKVLLCRFTICKGIPCWISNIWPLRTPTLGLPQTGSHNMNSNYSQHWSQKTAWMQFHITNSPVFTLRVSVVRCITRSWLIVESGLVPCSSMWSAKNEQLTNISWAFLSTEGQFFERKFTSKINTFLKWVLRLIAINIAGTIHKQILGKYQKHDLYCNTNTMDGISIVCLHINRRIARRLTQVS